MWIHSKLFSFPSWWSIEFWFMIIWNIISDHLFKSSFCPLYTKLLKFESIVFLGTNPFIVGDEFNYDWWSFWIWLVINYVNFLLIVICLQISQALLAINRGIVGDQQSYDWWLVISTLAATNSIYWSIWVWLVITSVVVHDQYS